MDSLWDQNAYGNQDACVGALGRTVGSRLFCKGEKSSVHRLKYIWCSGYGTRCSKFSKGTPWEMIHFLFNSHSIEFNSLGSQAVVPNSRNIFMTKFK